MSDVTPMNSRALRERLRTAGLRAAQLAGIQRADAERSAARTVEVAQAKARMTLGEEVAQVFEALQQRAHQRSVGAYERLLTAILNDVLPGEGSVRLIPQYKNNSTWLDIQLEKGGALEDILDGNGGGLTNVVSTGLKYASLLRSGNRPLMILDEPECWLSPSRVAAFVNVVAKVSAQTGTQTFFILHHDALQFQGLVNVVELSRRDDGSIAATPVEPLLADWENDDVPGIRGIELTNFRAHEYTYIPCYPGATAFVGPNNLGKSTAIQGSFNAVAFNESSESVIRHGADEAQVVIHLEGKQRLEWTRARKGSPAVKYRLWKGDELVKEGRPKARNEAPDWVTEVLGISLVDDLNIQVGNQKEPVFLLNETASRRAQILSVGRESGYLKDLMKGYDEVKSADRETIRMGEMELAKLSYRLARLAKLPAAQATLASLDSRADGFFQALQNKESLEAVLSRLERTSASAQRHKREVQALAALPGVPEVSDTVALERLVGRLEKGAERAAIRRPRELPTAPELVDATAIFQVGRRIAGFAKSVALLERLPAALPTPPELQSTDALTAMLTRLEALPKQVATTEAQLVQARDAVSQAEQQIEDVKKNLGGHCPLCGGAFPERGIEHAHV